MNDLEHFSLRWNNFHSNMSSGFCALLQEDALVDVTLAAEGRVLQAHKLVLSVCSPYFKQLFAANPCKHPIVILKDVHHKQLSDLLNFMYQGEVNVRQEELATFLKTAELLQIKGLTEQEPQTSQAPSQERQFLASQKAYHFPKIRPGPVRRIRNAEKPIPFPPLTDSRSTLSPSSPPPTKRIRPAPSPVASGEDNHKVEDTPEASGNEEAENGTASQKVKLEPPLECSDVQSEDNERTRGESDSTAQNKLPQSLPTPQTSRGDSHETDETLSDRTPQRPSTDLNVSAASSSGLSITPSENSFVTPETQQGELHYMTSKRGRLHLLHNGHRYYLHRQGVNGSRFWRCLRHRTSGCRAYVSVDPGAKLATKRGKDHNHTPPYELLNQDWMPVPMKYLSEYNDTTIYDPVYSNCGPAAKNDSGNNIDAFGGMNFTPENYKF